MATNYSPTIVTDGAVFVGDALMPSTATSATKLYNRAGSDDGTMYTGTCLDFDGTDDRADISDASSLATSFGTTISCSVWVKSSQINTYKYLVDFDGTTDRWIFGWNTSSSGQIGYFNGTWRNFGTNPAADGSWHHLVLVVTASKQRLYIDGVQFGSELSSATSAMDGNGTTMYAPRGGFDGETADLRLYNVELSLAQIKEIYNNSKVILPANTGISNLKLWWPYSEGAGTTCFDGSGNGHNGTSTNDSSYLTGQTGAPQLIQGYNRKLKFSGNEYIACGSDNSLNFTTSNFSICFWIFVHDLTDVGYIVRRGSWGVDGWYTFLTSSGRIQLYTNDSAQADPHTQATSNNDVITENAWHHVVCVRNGASGIIYVDGTDVTNNSNSLVNPATSTGPCTINSTTNYIKGIVDEIVIYDTALSSSEVSALAATGPNGGPLPPDATSGSSNLASSANVKAYWRNQGTATWTDRSANSNNGTPTGTLTDDQLTFTQGYNGNKNVNSARDNQGFPLLYKNNGAVGLTQTGSPKVTIPHSSDILWNSTANFTIGVWYKIANNPSGTYPSIWGKGGQNNSGPGYQLFLNPTGTSITLRTTWSGGPTYGMTAASSSAGNPHMDGKWHYIVAVVNRGIGNACLYYDAVKQPTTDISSAGDPTNTTDLTLGWAGAGPFHGQIAGAHIYNRVLNGKEILQNYNAQKSRFT